MKKNLSKIISVFSLAALLPKLVLAQNYINNGTRGIRSLFPSRITGIDTFGEMVEYIIKIALSVAGIIAVLFIIIGGFQYLTAQGNAEQAEGGKTTLTNALIGIVIIILSYAMVTVVSNLVSRGTV